MDIAIKFAFREYKVHVFHLSGFGYSGGKRANSSIRTFMKDIILVIKEKVDSSLPLFFYGDALGSLLIIMFNQINNKLNLAGAILTYPQFSSYNKSKTRLENTIERMQLTMYPYTEDMLFNIKKDVK